MGDALPAVAQEGTSQAQNDASGTPAPADCTAEDIGVDRIVAHFAQEFAARHDQLQAQIDAKSIPSAIQNMTMALDSLEKFFGPCSKRDGKRIG